METEIYEVGKNGLEKVRENFTNLKRGDVIRWGGNIASPPREMIITEKISGFEGRTSYKAIERNKEGVPIYERIHAFLIKSPNDPNIWHNQHFFITNKKASGEEIKELFEHKEKAEEQERKRQEEEKKKIKREGKLLREEKVRMGTSEISKRIKKDLKNRFPNCKFSVRSERYTGASSIKIILYEGDFDAFVDKNTRYTNVNDVRIKREKDPSLTEKANNVIRGAAEIADYYNFDDSDPMTDYINKNFFLDLAVGEIDKPYRKKEQKSNGSINIKENKEKNGLEIYFKEKPSSEIREILKKNGFRWSRYNKCWYRKNKEGLKEKIQKELGLKND